MVAEDGQPRLADTAEGFQLPAHRAWSPLARALAATGDHWTLLIVLALAPGRMRLMNLHHFLPGISAGALERYVQQMDTFGLVTRTRFKEMPPRVELELTDAGRELLPVAGALARWGMRNSWSPPKEREHVEIGVLLHIMPVLLEGQAKLPEGWVEAIVAGADPPVRRLYRVQRGCLQLVNRGEDAGATPAEHASANRAHDGDPSARSARGGEQGGRQRGSVRIEGDERAWTAALGPEADHSRLRLTGDEQLAREIFASLADSYRRQALPTAPAHAL